MKVVIRWNQREYALKDPETKIGRAADCPIRIFEDVQASRNHCVLHLEATRLILRDSESLNGTFVNGQRITAEVELAHGSEFLCGATTFEVEIDAQQDQTLIPGESPTLLS